MDALEKLNALPNEPDRILWHVSRQNREQDREDEKDIHLSDLVTMVAAVQQKVGHSNARNWLLYSDNPFRFFAGLLALSGLGKKVIVCANRQAGWLSTSRHTFDAVLADGDPALKDLPVTDFPDLSPVHDISDSPVRTWPQLTGHEVIVFLTSGSTGEPKQVVKELRAITNEINTLIDTFNTAGSSCIYTSSVSHLHIYGLLFNLFLPVLAGGSSILETVEFPEQLQKVSHAFENLVFVSSPAFLSRLDNSLIFRKLHQVFSSGGPLGYDAAQSAFQSFGILPIEVYGSTETGGIAWRQQNSKDVAWSVFQGVSLSQREDGDIEILSLNMPDQPPYMLDDRLQLLGHDRFRLLGRKDRIVKVEEKRISLTEIEEYLLARPEVEACVALLVHSEAGGRQMIGCVIKLDEEKMSSPEVTVSTLISCWKQAMRQHFEAITIPRKWRIVSTIPVNTQGKTDMESLSRLFQQKSTH